LADTGEGGTRLLRTLGTDRAVVAEASPTSPRSSRPTTSWPTACWQASTAEQIATTTPDDLADGGGVTPAASARPKGHRLDLLRRLLTTASWAG
jgi:hypothetical protein